MATSSPSPVCRAPLQAQASPRRGSQGLRWSGPRPDPDRKPAAGLHPGVASHARGHTLSSRPAHPAPAAPARLHPQEPADPGTSAQPAQWLSFQTPPSPVQNAPQRPPGLPGTCCFSGLCERAQGGGAGGGGEDLLTGPTAAPPADPTPARAPCPAAAREEGRGLHPSPRSGPCTSLQAPACRLGAAWAPSASPCVPRPRPSRVSYPLHWVSSQTSHERKQRTLERLGGQGPVEASRPILTPLRLA